MTFLVFDFETTGIPRIPKSIEETSGQAKKKLSFRDLDVYDTARVVSVAWRQADSDKYYIIKPIGFVIPDEATAIHGISTDQAMKEGADLITVLDELLNDMQHVDTIVAHNIYFDINVLRSELYRANKFKYQRAIDMTFKKKIFCTMQESRKMNVVNKMTKLTVLYKMLFPGDEETCENAHNAYYDVIYTTKIYLHLMTLVATSTAVAAAPHEDVVLIDQSIVKNENDHVQEPPFKKLRVTRSMTI